MDSSPRKKKSVFIKSTLMSFPFSQFFLSVEHRRYFEKFLFFVVVCFVYQSCPMKISTTLTFIVWTKTCVFLRKKGSQVLNITRVSKRWQNIHFWKNCSFNSNWFTMFVFGQVIELFRWSSVSMIWFFFWSCAILIWNLVTI